MKLVVDTGVFSAALSRRPRLDLEPAVARLADNQLFIAVQTVAELRYGALVAGWADRRRDRLEAAIASVTVLPVTDELLHGAARLRQACRTVLIPFAPAATLLDRFPAALAALLRPMAFLGASPNQNSSRWFRAGWPRRRVEACSG